MNKSILSLSLVVVFVAAFTIGIMGQEGVGEDFLSASSNLFGLAGSDPSIIIDTQQWSEPEVLREGDVVVGPIPNSGSANTGSCPREGAVHVFSEFRVAQDCQEYEATHGTCPAHCREPGLDLCFGPQASYQEIVYRQTCQYSIPERPAIGSLTFTNPVCEIDADSDRCTGSISWETREASDIRLVTGNGNLIASGLSASGSHEWTWARDPADSRVSDVLLMSGSVELDRQSFEGRCTDGTVFDAETNTCQDQSSLPGPSRPGEPSEPEISIIFSNAPNGPAMTSFSATDTIYGTITVTVPGDIEGCLSGAPSWDAVCGEAPQNWDTLPHDDWTVNSANVWTRTFEVGYYEPGASYKTGVRFVDDKEIFDSVTFSVAQDSSVCTPGTTQQGACVSEPNSCGQTAQGTQVRTCNNNGQWGEWVCNAQTPPDSNCLECDDNNPCEEGTCEDGICVIEQETILSLTCESSTDTTITLSYSYENAQYALYIVRKDPQETILEFSPDNAPAEPTVTDTGLEPDTQYTYELQHGHGSQDLLVETIVCKTQPAEETCVPPYFEIYDYNDDGVLNMSDVIFLHDLFAGQGGLDDCPSGKVCDLTGDGAVNILDVQRLGTLISCQDDCQPYYPQFDYNNDDVLNQSDLEFLFGLIATDAGLNGCPDGKVCDLTNSGSLGAADMDALWKIINRSPNANYPNEICNDGLDNSCNLLVDEQNPYCLGNECGLDSECPPGNVCSQGFCILDFDVCGDGNLGLTQECDVGLPLITLAAYDGVVTFSETGSFIETGVYETEFDFAGSGPLLVQINVASLTVTLSESDFEYEAPLNQESLHTYVSDVIGEDFEPFDIRVVVEFSPQYGGLSCNDFGLTGTLQCNPLSCEVDTSMCEDTTPPITNDFDGDSCIDYYDRFMWSFGVDGTDCIETQDTTPPLECVVGSDCASGICQEGVCLPPNTPCAGDSECAPGVCVGGVCLPEEPGVCGDGVIGFGQDCDVEEVTISFFEDVDLTATFFAPSIFRTVFEGEHYIFHLALHMKSQELFIQPLAHAGAELANCPMVLPTNCADGTPREVNPYTCEPLLCLEDFRDGKEEIQSTLSESFNVVKEEVYQEQGLSFILDNIKHHTSFEITQNSLSAQLSIDLIQSKEDLDDPIYCLAVVYECPDGSYVGPDPSNNCEIPACPGEERKLPLPEIVSLEQTNAQEYLGVSSVIGAPSKALNPMFITFDLLFTQGLACPSGLGELSCNLATCEVNNAFCEPIAECDVGADCVSGICQEGVCLPPNTPCDGDSECAPGVCVGGVCIPEEPGVCGDGIIGFGQDCDIRSPRVSFDPDLGFSGSVEFSEASVFTGAITGEINYELIVNFTSMQATFIPQIPQSERTGITRAQASQESIIGPIADDQDQCTDDIIICNGVETGRDPAYNCGCPPGDVLDAIVVDIIGSGHEYFVTLQLGSQRVMSNVFFTFDPIFGDGFSCPALGYGGGELICNPQTCLVNVDTCQEAIPCEEDAECESGECNDAGFCTPNPCNNDDECLSGECTDLGYCTPPVCEEDSDCNNGFCNQDTGICVPGVPPECETNDDCLEGEFCNAANICVPQIPPGGECSADDECEFGVCDPELNICLGPDCEDPSDCESGVCDLDVGLCVPPLPPGSPCEEDEQCVYVCLDQTNTCSGPICEANEDCDSGICTEQGYCLPPETPCDSDAQCAPGVCIDNVCLPEVPPCETNADCPGNQVCNQDTGICSAPPTTGTGGGRGGGGGGGGGIAWPPVNETDTVDSTLRPGCDPLTNPYCGPIDRPIVAPQEDVLTLDVVSTWTNDIFREGTLRGTITNNANEELLVVADLIDLPNSWEYTGSQEFRLAPGASRSVEFGVIVGSGTQENVRIVFDAAAAGERFRQNIDARINIPFFTVRAMPSFEEEREIIPVYLVINPQRPSETFQTEINLNTGRRTLFVELVTNVNTDSTHIQRFDYPARSLIGRDVIIQAVLLEGGQRVDSSSERLE